VLENHIDGSTSGLQGWFNWRVLPHWRLQGGGVVLDHRLKVRPGAVDFGGLQALGNDPDHWWSLRSALDVSPRLAWGLAVRHTGTLPQPRVPSYTAVDTTLGWRLDADTELSLVVRNVLDGGHAEWGAPGNRAEFGRSASVLLRWRL
jgi:iron complex outermembrane receptor protein